MGVLGKGEECLCQWPWLRDPWRHVYSGHETLALLTVNEAVQEAAPDVRESVKHRPGSSCLGLLNVIGGATYYQHPTPIS